MNWFQLICCCSRLLVTRQKKVHNELVLKNFAPKINLNPNMCVSSCDVMVGGWLWFVGLNHFLGCCFWLEDFDPCNSNIFVSLTICLGNKGIFVFCCFSYPYFWDYSILISCNCLSKHDPVLSINYETNSTNIKHHWLLT